MKKVMLEDKKIWNYVIGFSVLGILLASYLFYEFLTKPVLVPCYINSYINCDAVTKGSLSTLFGIPVSLVGLVGYIVILASALYKQKVLVLAMSAFGMIFCLYITYQEVFRLKVLCPVCLTCQLVMIIIFLLGLKLNLDKRG